jgi:hypothetical protein
MSETPNSTTTDLFARYAQIIEALEGPADKATVIAVMRTALTLNRGLIRDADTNLRDAMADLRAVLDGPAPDPQQVIAACSYVVETDKDATEAVDVVADLERELAALGYEEDTRC